MTWSPQREAILVAMTCLLSATLAVTSMARKSVIYDETSHVTAGYTYLKTGDFRMTPDHPPLAEMLAALPLLSMSIEMPPLDSPAWEMGDYWYFGRQLLHAPNDVGQILFRARLPIVALMIAGGLIVWRWSRTLFGPQGALISLILYAFSPTVLAHGRFVTTDMAVALFFMLTLWAITRIITRATPARWLVLTASATALFLTKFSAPLILIPAVVLAATRILAPQPWTWQWPTQNRTALNTRFKRFIALAVLVFAVTAPAWATIWAAFGFRYTAALDPPGMDYDHMLDVGGIIDGRNQYPKAIREALGDQYVEDFDIWDHLLEGGGPVAATLAWMRQNHFLPEAYLYGLAFNLKWTQSSPAFLMGQISNTGWWYYFPMCFSIKSSEFTLLAVLALPFAWLLRHRNTPTESEATDDDEAAAFRRWSFRAIGLFLLVYVAMLVRSRFNIGHRHLLPIYPLLFILAGAWTAALTSNIKWHRTACIALLVAAVIRAGVAWPHYLPFFNAFAGGSSQGYRWLGDSNVDWGQDLAAACQYIKDFPENNPQLIYWGTGWPQNHGLNSFFADAMDVELTNAGQPDPPAEITPGEYLVSATAYQGIYMAPADRNWDNRRAEQFTRIVDLLKTDVLTPPQNAAAENAYRKLMFQRLLQFFRATRPIDQIGHSILVFSLSRDDLPALQIPPPIDN